MAFEKINLAMLKNEWSNK